MENRQVSTKRLEAYDITNAEREDLGQVQNFMVDMVTGRVSLAIVAFGGVLGLTDKWLAIPFERLTWEPENKKFILNVPREILEKAPGIDKRTWPDSVNTKWMAEIYSRYGCSPYWKEHLGETFKTAAVVPTSGVYEYIAHVDGPSCTPDCAPSEAEREVPLSKGEKFPPIRSCGKSAVWRLVRAA